MNDRATESSVTHNAFVGNDATKLDWNVLQLFLNAPQLGVDITLIAVLLLAKSRILHDSVS